VIWWAILLPWVLVPRWFEMLQDYRGPQTGEAEKPSFRKTLLGLLAGWAVLMWCGLAAWLTQGSPQTVELAVSSGTPWQIAHQLRNPTLPEAQHYPALTKILQERYPEGKFLGTIMATPMQGDYLLWALAPQIPVTYAHIHLFPPDYWEEIGIVGQGRPGWLDKYQVNLIVVEAEFSQKLRDELLRSPGWEIIVDETNQTDKKPNDLTRQLIAVRREPRR
jgi:hypothetical protein